MHISKLTTGQVGFQSYLMRNVLCNFILVATAYRCCDFKCGRSGKCSL